MRESDFGVGLVEYLSEKLKGSESAYFTNMHSAQYKGRLSALLWFPIQSVYLLRTKTRKTRTRKIGKKGKSELVGIFGINLWTYQRLYLKFFSYHRNLENQLFPMVLVRFF